MPAYVICCNDSVKYVVIEDKVEAQEKMEQLKNENDDNKYSPYIRYWHIQEVEWS